MPDPYTALNIMQREELYLLLGIAAALAIAGALLIAGEPIVESVRKRTRRFRERWTRHESEEEIWGS